MQDILVRKKDAAQLSHPFTFKDCFSKFLIVASEGNFLSQCLLCSTLSHFETLKQCTNYT